MITDILVFSRNPNKVFQSPKTVLSWLDYISNAIEDSLGGSGSFDFKSTSFLHIFSSTYTLFYRVILFNVFKVIDINGAFSKIIF